MDERVTRQPYEVNIEGTVYRWGSDTITVDEIRRLGNLPTTLPVVQIDFSDNTQWTLPDHGVIGLKPHHGFGKGPGFKSG